jgi:hypothetical protein
VFSFTSPFSSKKFIEDSIILHLTSIHHPTQYISIDLSHPFLLLLQQFSLVIKFEAPSRAHPHECLYALVRLLFWSTGVDEWYVLAILKNKE